MKGKSMKNKPVISPPAIVGASWRFEVDQIHPYSYAVNLFNKQECEQIIKLGEHLHQHAGTISSKEALNKKIRDSIVSWIYPGKEATWMFEKIVPTILELNKKFHKFDITGLYEGFQFTKYIGPTGKYRAHTDRGFNTGIRKLSFTIQLSEADSYKGGDLVFNDGSLIKLPQNLKAQGVLIAFPSFMVHEVRPVTKGTRYSLVGWVGGPNFK